MRHFLTIGKSLGTNYETNPLRILKQIRFSERARREEYFQKKSYQNRFRIDREIK